MYLVNGDLVIRNATAADAQTLCDWWNDGKVMSHAGFPNGIGTTQQGILDILQKDIDNNRRLILDVDGIPVGEMNYRTVANQLFIYAEGLSQNYIG